jgi:ATP-dependent Lon protease
VRSLEREISKLCRKAVKQLLLDKSLKHIEINGDNLHDSLACSAMTMAVRIAKTASVR